MIWLNANKDSLRLSIDLVGHDRGACTISSHRRDLESLERWLDSWFDQKQLKF